MVHLLNEKVIAKKTMMTIFFYLAFGSRLSGGYQTDLLLLSSINCLLRHTTTTT